MVHTNLVGAAVASASSSRRQRPSLATRGSFHAGDVFPTFDSFGRRQPVGKQRRRSSNFEYHTFPTPPPYIPDDIASGQPGGGGVSDSSSSQTGPSSGAHRRHCRRRDGDLEHHGAPATPLPIRQLGLLALLSLAEQTALNSISPYLPTMVESFSEIPEEQMGLYVGLLASTFALSQLVTNLFWGYLSDAIGRKPVMLLGSLLLMLCFCLFGFCKCYWQVVVIHVAMGLLNGNAAVVPTCLGEVTDRTNQSSAFTWLPVVYSLGSITGPAVGGLLVGLPGRPGSVLVKYPFLLPNLCSAVLLGLSVIVLGIWFDETLDTNDRRLLPPSLTWIDTLWKRCCELSPRAKATARVASGTSSETSSLMSVGTSDDGIHNSDNGQGDGNVARTPTTGEAASGIFKKPIVKQLLNTKTAILLLTYLVFQLSNISFNSLYPIFSAAPPPAGRGMPPGQIGLLLSFAGLATIVFQITVFQWLKAKVGNMGSYRGALLGIAVCMLLMPWVSHADDGPLFGVVTGEWLLYGEVAVVLVFKSICAVSGLSSVMLLINNSSPSHETLGTLNGIAQTLSAAGRSVGPFLSGALFSLSTQIKPKGELVAWCVFGGISALGWLLSLVINGKGLESADWEGDDSSDDETPGDNAGATI